MVRKLLADQRLVAVRAVVRVARVDQFDREERQHDHDEDRESGALEETAHGEIPGVLRPSEVLATSPLAYHEGLSLTVGCMAPGGP